jgi:hypothetical protein
MSRTAAAVLALGITLGARAPAPSADPPQNDAPPAAETPAQSAEPPAQNAPPSSRVVHVRDRHTELGALMLLAVLLLFAGFAVLVLVVVLAPDVTAALALEGRGSLPKRFFVGVANVLFLVILSKVTLDVLAVVIVPFLAVTLLLGLAVLSDEVGRRIQRVAGADWNRLTRMGAGWATLYLAGWFPVAGWFVVAPVTLGVAWGTAILWLLARRPAAPTAAAPPPAATPPP